MTDTNPLLPRFDTLLPGAGEPPRTGMDIERETIVETGAAILPVIVFIILLVFLGSSYSSNGDLTSQGGLAVVGLLVLFILGMVGIGVLLANRD
ncbi:MAG: hypothetical protein V5A33_02875 [Halobacteriales archaeon]